MLSGLILSLIAIMRLWPTTAIARSLHRVTVETPATWLSRLERHHVLFVVILLVMLIGGMEAIAAFGSLDAVLLFSFDLSLYVDAVGALLAVSAIRRFKPMLHFIQSGFILDGVQRTRDSAGRGARQVRTRRIRIAENDDEPARVFNRAA